MFHLVCFVCLTHISLGLVQFDVPLGLFRLLDTRSATPVPYEEEDS
jgi:hypothetical protein